jgi:HSP20 family protein
VRKEDWAESEPEDGQLSVDVYQTKDSVVIKSTIAGVKPEDVDISIENDVITIRGERKQESEVKDDDYFYQECYWGSFSRSIVLPVEVKSDETNASLKNGVLTVVLPKEKKSKSVAVKVKEE